MNYRLFQYPLPAPPEMEDLNEYLASRRVVAVSHHIVQTGTAAILIFIVETVDPTHASSTGSPSSKIDYREKLNTEEFAIFSQLRTKRKQWAEAEGVPVYTIFTNAQLAEMVLRRVKTAADLASVEGVGSARIEKYGAGLLALLADLSNQTDASTKEGEP
jgi:superfamily II DNA helicase RecQ